MRHATHHAAHRRLLAAALCVGMLWAGTASANPPRNENLMQALPDGYTVASSTRKDNASVTQMLPSGESVDNWTEMVTTQIYTNLKDISFESYAAGLEQRWKATCDSAEARSLKRTTENGYDVQYWALTCQVKDGAHKPAVTWFKMIRGNDRFYVVLKAFLMEPSKEQTTATAQYMKSISVCDTRLKDRPCLAY